ENRKDVNSSLCLSSNNDEERFPRYLLEDVEIAKAASQLDARLFESVTLRDDILWSREFVEAQCSGADAESCEWITDFYCRDPNRFFEEFPDIVVAMRRFLIEKYLKKPLRTYSVVTFVRLALESLSTTNEDGSRQILEGSKDVVPRGTRGDGSLVVVEDRRRETLLSLVSANGWVLRHCDFRLQDHLHDKEVVLAAVKSAGRALQFASKELRNDRDVVLAACSQDARAFQHASELLSGDRSFVREVVQISGSTLRYCSSEFQADRELLELAVKQDPTLFAHVHVSVDEELKRDLAKIAVSRDASLLSIVTNPTRDIVLAAFANGNAPLSALKHLFTYADNEDFAMLALQLVKEAGAMKSPGAYNNVRRLILAERERQGKPEVDIDADVDFLLRAVEASGSVVVEHISGSCTRDLRLLADYQ
ncbi:unnamed protein product, partial [Amoebophrya sp. A25]